jgi:hypothetical protein
MVVFVVRSQLGFSLAACAADLQASLPLSLPRNFDIVATHRSRTTVCEGWRQTWRLHSAG